MSTRVVVITGGAGGLGTAVTQRFLAAGDAVRVVDQSADAIARLRTQVGALAVRLEASTVDLGDEALVDAFVAGVAARDGKIDALVHLVGGIRKRAETADTTLDDWEGVMALNLRTTFITTRAAMRVMRTQQHGSIVTMGAMTALKPEAGRSAYVASKAGVIALTKVLADEGRAYGVNANCIAPSVIRTEANLSWATGNEADGWVAPADLAETIYFLTTDAARHINGTVVQATGKLGV